VGSCRPSGVRDARLHDARHAAATLLLEQGVDHPGCAGDPQSLQAERHQAVHMRDVAPGLEGCGPYRKRAVVAVETAEHFMVLLNLQVELETAGQNGCPERDSNPYGLSAWEV
jgi:hypothetical protein